MSESHNTATEQGIVNSRREELARQHPSELAPVTGSGLKFCILAHGGVERENVLYILNSAVERDTKTIELIYGGLNLEQAEAEMWAAERDQLNETGELNFEGDPGLRWFVALLP